MVAEEVSPKHLIVDQGPEFKCEHFENVWCKARNILPRFGAVNRHGSIAVVKRFHKTMKEILRLIVVPEDQPQFEREMESFIDWYNEHRPPHDLERQDAKRSVLLARASQRTTTHRASQGLATWIAVCKTASWRKPGECVIIEFDCHEGREHLPIVRIRRAAWMLLWSSTYPLATRAFSRIYVTRLSRTN